MLEAFSFQISLANVYDETYSLMTRMFCPDLLSTSAEKFDPMVVGLVVDDCLRKRFGMSDRDTQV